MPPFRVVTKIAAHDCELSFKRSAVGMEISEFYGNSASICICDNPAVDCDCNCNYRAVC